MFELCGDGAFQGLPSHSHPELVHNPNHSETVMYSKPQDRPEDFQSVEIQPKSNGHRKECVQFLRPLVTPNHSQSLSDHDLVNQSLRYLNR